MSNHEPVQLVDFIRRMHEGFTGVVKLTRHEIFSGNSWFEEISSVKFLKFFNFLLIFVQFWGNFQKFQEIFAISGILATVQSHVWYGDKCHIEEGSNLILSPSLKWATISDYFCVIMNHSLSKEYTLPFLESSG